MGEVIGVIGVIGVCGRQGMWQWQGIWTREMAARDVAKGYGQKKSSKANRNNNPVKEGNSTK